MRNGEAWILWRQWRDGSIVAATCTSISQLNKQIDRDKSKAVKLWKQAVTFDASACEPVPID